MMHDQRNIKLTGLIKHTDQRICQGVYCTVITHTPDECLLSTGIQSVSTN